MPIGKDLQYAASLLKQGEVVAIPTETVYGLAGNAFNKITVARIFEIKNRPAFNPLIVHIKHIEDLNLVAQNIDDRLLLLIQKFSPGPLTILVEKKSIVPDIVTAGSSRVAVRIPAHPMTLSLLNLLDFPLAAPSANPFQYISPVTAQQVEEQLGDKIDYILDGGKCSVGLESTIVGIEDNDVVVYRLGGLPVESIQKLVGDVIIKTKFDEQNVDTPGQMKKHYSPKKPLLLGDIEELLKCHQNKKIALITFGKMLDVLSKNVEVFNLSEKGDIYEAASNLFETLYFIDQSDADIIITHQFPEEGLGRAINDRLKRASTKI